MKKYIYVIKNDVNNKVYVGQAVDPQHRFVQHLSQAKHNADRSPIHDAIRAFGKEHFWYDVIEEACENYNDKEQYWIEKLNSSIPNGYNLQLGGEDPPHMYGEDHFACVLSNTEVNEIIDELKHSDMTQFQIADKHHCHFGRITSINNGICHYRQNETYPIRPQSPYRLSAEDVEEIKWLLINTRLSVYKIADHYGVGKAAISHINAGRNYKDDALSYPLRKRRASGEKEPVETILAKRSTTAIGTQLEMGVCS